MGGLAKTGTMAEVRRERRRPWVPVAAAAGTILWWVAVVRLSDAGESRWDLVDESQGSHMGADVLEFWWVALVTAALALPGVLVPLVLAWRRRYLAPVLVALALTAAWNTAFFYGTGYAGCIPGREIPGGTVYGWGLLAGLALCPLAAGAIAGARRGTGAQAIAVATVVAAVQGFLWVVQASTCGGVSTQVERGLDAYLWPLFLVVTVPLALLGLRAGRAKRAA